MHDLVIRGGTVVDGTGAARRRADVAIDGGRIVAVGDLDDAGRREVDADGQMVLPGWVDIHSHFDGQATWDPTLTPSSWNGVTTTVFGNCGVGFAPVAPGSEAFLINLMEGVEDIPGTVLAEGVDFRWESFPQYLDVLDGLSFTMDVGTQIPHGALRFYAMGQRGADHAERPTDAEAARMGRLVAEALDAGALGFTTSRTVKHRAKDGRSTPSLSADAPELAAVADAMRAAGRGVIEVNSDFGPGEWDVLQEMARRSGRPLSVLLLQVDSAPDLWRGTLDWIHRARAAGIEVTGQVGCRPIGVMMGLDTTVNPFVGHPVWRTELAHLAFAERFRLLSTDADLRRRLTEGEPVGPWRLGKTFELGRERLEYEPDPAVDSLVARAAREGTTPLALALDLMLRDEGRNLLLYPFENYHDGSLEVVRQQLSDPYTVCGLGDAGAHVATICDAAYPSFLLAHWTRDRTRGERIDLEFLVSKQTKRTAASFGLHDRGVIAPGYRADINVVDHDTLGVAAPELVYDLPAGGKRLVQKGTGYRHTFVAGVEVSRDGELTGAAPGRLIRGGAPAPT